jgi:hypothetical protein
MQAHAVRVAVGVPERVVAQVATGHTAELSFEALPDVLTGKVARVGFAVEANGLVRAEIDLPNPKGELRPGMHGSVTLKLGKGPADAVRMPVSAVLNMPGVGPRHGVYVYRDGTARLVPVRVSHVDEQEAEVSGLSAGDLVVADPSRLKGPEVRVEVEKPAPPK